MLVVYADKLAGGIPTVCNGLTHHVTSTPIIVGERWTDEKCVVEEANALERVQRAVLPCFKRLPPPSVLDMASSHAWNLGAGATCGSGAMAAWNRGEWERGCQRISRGDDGTLVWSFTSRIDPKTGKKVFTFVQGLANRRADETAKCPTYALFCGRVMNNGTRYPVNALIPCSTTDLKGDPNARVCQKAVLLISRFRSQLLA